jgi:siderophore synthetase component
VTRDPAECDLAEHDLPEHDLAGRVVSALLREDYGRLANHVRLSGTRVLLFLPGADGPGPELPLERDGFLADYRVAAGAPVTLDDVRSAVAVLAGQRDAAGAAAFDAECRRTLAETRLRAARVPGPRAPDASGAWAGRSWAGAAGQFRYDALAAALPHPAYPASPCRMGLDDRDLLLYAPEFLPEFELRWAAVPRAAVTRSRHRLPGRAAGSPDGPGRPAWWPDPPQAGLPAELAATHELFPVHPLTARDRLPALLAGPALPGPVLFGPEPYLRVRPTLSVRTVAVAGRPADHLKLPLPASTLGARNRRSIAPGTLSDGALVCRLLTEIRDGDPALAGLLLADDTDYAHAGHPDLGYLLRRLPPWLDGCQVVPVAALTAQAPSGRLVVEELARQAESTGRQGLTAGQGPAGTPGPAWAWQHGAEDVLAFAAEYFRLVFGIAVRLLVRYGIALESHQQNAALVAGPGASPRLLVKDFDGALINAARLRSALGPTAPSAADFADQRLLTTSDYALADVFVTITVHLCVGAPAFALAERGMAPLGALLAAARRALRDALHAERSTPAAALLRARVLEAPRLVGKSMITAGTLTDKKHTGAADVNKFYGTTGPNYLKETC